MRPQIVTQDDDLDRLLKEKFTSEFRNGYINVKGVCLPERYADIANGIENLEVRDDDIWVCSFPKTGTTRMQELVWCAANNLDFEGAKVLIDTRFPFLEVSALFDYRTILPKKPGLELPDLMTDSVVYVQNMPSPRFIKTHLPYELLPRQIRTGERKPKIVYVTRNPKDTCISYYHQCKLMEGYRGDFQEFCALFLAGKLTFAPFWSHVLSFWDKRNEKNIIFTKYEDMKADLSSIIMKIAEFLNKQLNENEVNILAEHLSFTSMKTNSAVNYESVIETNKKFKLIDADGEFMRSGQANQWKDKMSTEVIQQFDKLTKQQLEIAGLCF